MHLVLGVPFLLQAVRNVLTEPARVQYPSQSQCFVHTRGNLRGAVRTHRPEYRSTRVHRNPAADVLELGGSGEEAATISAGSEVADKLATALVHEDNAVQSDLRRRRHDFSEIGDYWRLS